MTDITFEKYSDKSFVIRGNTTPYKDELVELGGSFNPRLKGGAGWIFSNYSEIKVNKWLQNKNISKKDIGVNIVVDNNVVVVDDDLESEIIELRKIISRCDRDLIFLKGKLTDLEQKYNITSPKRLII